MGAVMVNRGTRAEIRTAWRKCVITVGNRTYKMQIGEHRRYVGGTSATEGCVHGW